MTETYSYKDIRDEYGIETIQKIRQFESISRTSGRYRSHLRFYLHCKHNEVTPKGIKIKAQMKGNEARKIIEKAEKALLNIRISEVVKKNNFLERRKSQASQELSEEIPQELHRKLIEVNEGRERKEMEKAIERQKKKFKRLKEMDDYGGENTNNMARYTEAVPDSNVNKPTLRDNTETQTNDQIQDGGRRNETTENDEQDEVHRNEENIPRTDQNYDEGDEETGENERIERINERIEQLNENGAEEREDEENEEEEEDEENDVTIPYAESEHDPRKDDEIKERWVKNISKRVLSKDEINLLRKGGGFAVSPREIPHIEYITATESACRNLAPGEALNLRHEIIEELSKAKAPPSNLTANEWKVLKGLRDDEEIMVLPADKGKCLVVMDRDEYIRKMEEKLADETTYKRIKEDPTYKIKEALTKLLTKIKNEKQLDDRTFYRLTPTQTKIPRMYGQPKVHKEDYPLREIVDSTGSVTKQCDKFVSKIIQQYTGQTPYYVKNSAHFVSMIKDLKVEDDELLVSYDIKALYPSVPQGESIDIIYDLMKNDPDLHKKTTMTAENVIALFKQCVQTTYFAFNKELYQQIDGLAIGASSSGPAAELFMVKLEVKAITTFINPPEIWMRYVDDTFTKLKKLMVESFLTHLNNQHPRIKFTTETQEDGKIAFLDTQVHILPDKSTKVTIYRKATHTDQYLDFSSNHHIKQKIGILSTFEHRIQELITEEEDKEKERHHVKKALRRVGHPKWSLNRKKKVREKEEKVERRGKVIIPYTKGLSERLGRIYKRYDIEAIHKPTTKIKNILCNKMKDKIEPLDKTGAVYHNTCKKHQESHYVGETGRVLRERMYEHRIVDHATAKRSASISTEETTSSSNPAQQGTRRSTRSTRKKDYKAMQTGANQILNEGNTEFSAHVASDIHEKGDLQYSILCTEDDWFKRGVKEAIAIRKLRPTLNKDDGRYHLSKIYDKFIRSSVTLKTPSHGEKDGSEDNNF